MSSKTQAPIAPDTGNNSPVLELIDVSMRYAHGPDILHDINLRLAPGDFYFLTGASGAGKSSLLRLIYLAHRASCGQVHLFDQDTALCSRRDMALLRRRIGVVFQGFRLLDHLSVFDNVALPLRATGKKHADYEEDVIELLTWVGLGDHLHAAPQTLSGGEKQRVAIARAVVGKPDLLIADEPTGNVDPQMGRRLMRLFSELNRLGSTVLIASHDLGLVRASGAPSLHLDEGRLRANAATQNGGR